MARNKRFRLTPEEIKTLSLKVNTDNQYRLNKEQQKALYIFRGYDEGLVVEAVEKGISPSKVNHYWHKSEHYSLHVKEEDEKEEAETLAKNLIEELKAFAPKYPKLKRSKSTDGHLLVIDPADVHIGKLCSALEVGEDYNTNIAVKRVKEGVQGILDKAKGFNIDKINFIGGNDILHIDTPHRKTTSGTPQDTDGMWYENFLNAKRVYVDALEMLLTVADVHFTFNPSNHDYISGFFLADVIKTHFRNCKNITFDCSISHRKYFKYHNNLIGTTHGDGAKMQDLPLLMAGESKDWSSVKFRYIYTHHVHHKTSKDFQANVTVESLRSPSGTDSWHNRNGYTSKKAIEGFIHSKENGQVARLTHYF
jgi:hypothetical protein